MLFVMALVHDEVIPKCHLFICSFHKLPSPMLLGMNLFLPFCLIYFQEFSAVLPYLS